MRAVDLWNEGWMFARMAWDDVRPEVLMDGLEPVKLPHTWYADGEYYRGDAVYQKAFVPPAGQGRKVFVQFHGVDKVCRVLLNGFCVGGHQGGYSVFAVELTPFLKAGKQNILTVLVNNENGDSVCPLSGDFTIFGGIHREVYLIVTDEVHFDCCYYGTSGLIVRTEVSGQTGEAARGLLYAEPHVCGMAQAHIVYTLLDDQGRVVAEKMAPAAQPAVLELDSPRLWNGREDPYLYRLCAQLCVQDQAVDAVELTTGFRKVRMDPDKGFFLNDCHLKLNGVAKHQDTAGVFSAASMEHWQQDMALIEEIGANAVRLSHYQHPHQIYELCDQKGLVVWAEIPLLRLTDSDALFDNAKYQLTELILQHMHHPSICFWGLQNEVAMFGEQPFMYDRLKCLQDHARRLDPGRLTTSANLNTVEPSSPMNKITDVVAYNLYYGWYYGEMADFGAFADAFHRENLQIPLGISEYGVDSNLRFHSEHPKVKDYTEEFQAKFHETVYPMLQSRPFIWGTFVWNMFDFVSGIRNQGGTRFRNNKGLVTHDRKTRKDSFYYYKAVWSKEPFVHIAEKRFEKRAAGTMGVKVYSNQKIVTLKAGNETYEKTSDNGVFLFEDISLEMGENTVTAIAGALAPQTGELTDTYAGALTDTAVFTRVAAPEQSYIYVDPNPGLNVRNWFVDEVEKARIFPADYYSIMDTINTLLKDCQVMETIDRLVPKVGAYMRDTIGTFTLEQAAAFAKTLCTEAELRDLNRQLTQIKKPEEK